MSNKLESYSLHSKNDDLFFNFLYNSILPSKTPSKTLHVMLFNNCIEYQCQSCWAFWVKICFL